MSAVLKDSTGFEYVPVAVYDPSEKRVRIQRVDRCSFVSFIKTPPRSFDNPYDDNFVVMKGVHDNEHLCGRDAVPVHYGSAESCVAYMIQETFNCDDFKIHDEALQIIIERDMGAGQGKTSYIYFITLPAGITKADRDLLDI